MGFEVIEQDIAKFSGDAIVSSFGLLKNKPGCLAYDIQKAAGINAKAVNDEICQNLVPGRVYATSGFDLHVKKILHIGTPSFDNDRRLEQLQDAYLACLLYCKRFQLYKIALPIIGTGKSHYPHALVLAMVVPMVSKFTELYPEFDITVAVTPNNAQSDTAWNKSDDIKKNVAAFFETYRAYPKTEFRFGQDDFFSGKLSIFPKDKFDIVSIYKHNNAFSSKNTFFNELNTFSFCVSYSKAGPFAKEEEPFDCGNRQRVVVEPGSLKIISITDYISAFVEKAFPNQKDQKGAWGRIREYVGLDSTNTAFKTKHSDPKKRTTTTLPMLMRYCFALKMDLEETEAFLAFCSRTFSPFDETENVYKEIILSGESNLYKVDGACENLHVERIFFNDRSHKE